MQTARHRIGRTADETTLAPAAAASGHAVRPNVVMIVLDDLGFGQLGCFGSDIETPNFDRLAAAGLRYNRFHVTAVCSPTRAALLTGRNHHAVGMGFVPDAPLRVPGYTGRIPKSAATLAHHLREAGYSTFAVGKWHLTPRPDRTASGPFDWWPLGQGFERFYGFLHADTNQWTPNLVSDNHFVDPPARPEDGYHLTEDLVDTARRQILDQQQATPGKPFFLYLATGATHTPHQVPAEWSDRYRGRYDDGWQRWRERTFARQVDNGAVPAGTELTERPPWVADWDALPDAERRLYARMHEVYAGFLSHTDHQVGRLLGLLEELGLSEDTLIMVCSDNGASAEGGSSGTINEHRFLLGMDNLDDNLARMDELGGFRLYNHYAWGWAWAGNTPFRLWKRYTWLGGTRVPLIMHWPDGIAARGEVRDQFCHAVDLMPTVLDVCGIEPADIVAGVRQQPIDGVSLKASMADPKAPEVRQTQYFELLGSRSIYHQGWKATTDRVGKGVADEERLVEGSKELATDRWSLFDLREDFSEARDLAAERPDVLARLENLWWAEAGRNQVLPMGDYMSRTSTDRDRMSEPSPHAAGRRLVLRPGAGPVAAEAVPSLALGGRVVVDVEIPDPDAAGILCAQGDWTGGWALYIRDRRLRYALNAVSNEHHVVSDQALSPGRHTLSIRYTPDGAGGGSLAMFDGDTEIGSGRLPLSPALGAMQTDGSGLRIGHDGGFPVCEHYQPPFAWPGVLHRVVIDTALAAHEERTDLAMLLRRD